MSVRKSLAWSYTGQILGFLITFSSSIVVARLVSPRDFGIFAMVTAITTVINVFMQFGLAKYVVREKSLAIEELQTLFTVNAILSLFYVILLIISSIVCDIVFKTFEVARFLRVFAIFPLIGMMEFIPAALCARDMRFRAISLIGLARALALATSTIILALAHFAYMSFAWAQIITSVVSASLFNLLVWRPEVWRLRFQGFRAILSFGTQMIGISGLNQLSSRAGEMLLGSLLGLSTLGLYNRASSLPTTLYQNIYGAGSNVIFSRLSVDYRETGVFDLTYIRFMRLLLGVTWPMMIGLAVLSQPLIHLLYGQKWQGAALPLSILTLAAAVTISVGMVSEVFVLRRETRLQVKIEALRSSLGLAMFALGALVSLPFAAAAKLAEACIAFVLYRKPMNRLVGGAPGALGKLYAEGMLLGLSAAAPAFALMLWSKFDPSTSVVKLVASVATGIIIWAGLLWKQQHPLFLEAQRILRRPSSD